MKNIFNEKEYRQLLDLVFMGDWVVSAFNENEKSPYEDLRNKIYSHAKDYGFGNLIEYDKDEDNYYETALFEEQGVMDYIEAYNENVMEDED